MNGMTRKHDRAVSDIRCSVYIPSHVIARCSIELPRVTVPSLSSTVVAARHAAAKAAEDTLRSGERA